MLAIREISTPRDRGRFVRLPWAVNKGDGNFVPPLIASEELLISPERHPFYRDGAGRFFLAEWNGRPVGRIAAIRNLSYERAWGEACGFFGFYETTEKGEAGVEITRKLLDRVRSAVREWGLKYFLGPANPSSNYAFGVLLKGFDSPPRLMMPYNPPRYDELLRMAGLAAAKDLLAFEIDRNMNVERIRRIAVRIESRYGVRIRTLNMADFDQEIAVLHDIYNDIWEENWGFSPMSADEFRHMAAELKPLVDPDMVFIAEIDGKPAAFSLVVPDIFEALRHLNGRIMNPWALLKLLFYTKVWPRLKGMRILALGVRKRYRNLGLGTSFYSRVFDTAISKGYVSAEASWVLEDNRQMVSALEVMGAKPYKRYRIYSGQVRSGEA